MYAKKKAHFESETSLLKYCTTTMEDGMVKCNASYVWKRTSPLRTGYTYSTLFQKNHHTQAHSAAAAAAIIDKPKRHPAPLQQVQKPNPPSRRWNMEMLSLPAADVMTLQTPC